MAISSSTWKHQAPPPAMRTPRHSPQGDPGRPTPGPAQKQGTRPAPGAQLQSTPRATNPNSSRKGQSGFGEAGEGPVVLFAPSPQLHPQRSVAGIKNQETSHKNLTFTFSWKVSGRAGRAVPAVLPPRHWGTGARPASPARPPVSSPRASPSPEAQSSRPSGAAHRPQLSGPASRCSPNSPLLLGFPSPPGPLLAATSSHPDVLPAPRAAHLLLLGLDPGREVRDVIVGHRGWAHRVLGGRQASVLPARDKKPLLSASLPFSLAPPGRLPKNGSDMSDFQASGPQSRTSPVGSGTHTAPPWSRKGGPREPSGKTSLATCRSLPQPRGRAGTHCRSLSFPTTERRRREGLPAADLRKPLWPQRGHV